MECLKIQLSGYNQNTGRKTARFRLVFDFKGNELEYEYEKADAADLRREQLFYGGEKLIDYDYAESGERCTSDLETQACLERGVKSPCFIAPLGVRMPIVSKVVEPLVSAPYVLFVGRLSEEKGIVCLLDAWRRLKLSGDEIIKSVRLGLAGPDWRGYQALLERKIEKEKIPEVIFFGAVEGDVKDALFRHATSFVLPSPMENFSAVVLDALSYGVPVIATQGTPWKSLVEHNLGWWIPFSVAAFELALRQAISMQDGNRLELGEKARLIAKRDYSWNCVVDKVLTSYK